MDRPWQGKTVLIIEDSDLMIEELTSIYRKSGMNVVGCAKNGIAGIEKANNLNPDLVSLDIIMPVMDGIECYRKLVASKSDQKVLLVSALAREDRVVAAFEGEIDLDIFVEKPVSFSTMEDRLAYVFRTEDGSDTADESGESVSTP
tara:strand:- start:354 stop:791 length:438 start_codon:yes stop_codon:yes gene_type:complete